MKYQQFIPLLVVIAGLALGYLGTFCSFDRSCSFYSLTNEFIFTVIKPVRIYSLYAVIPTLAVLFISPRVFNTWFKFALGWLALSVVFITFTPTWSNTWMPLYSFVKEDTAKVMAVLFTLISLVLITVKSLAVRKTKA